MKMHEGYIAELSMSKDIYQLYKYPIALPEDAASVPPVEGRSAMTNPQSRPGDSSTRNACHVLSSF
jgi:hypothetical protein